MKITVLSSYDERLGSSFLSHFPEKKEIGNTGCETDDFGFHYLRSKLLIIVYTLHIQRSLFIFKEKKSQKKLKERNKSKYKEGNFF